MRRHANATPEGSTAGRSDSRGRVGASASRDGSGRVNGIGARAFRRVCSSLIGVFALAIVLSLGAGTAFAEAPTVSVPVVGAVGYTTATVTATIDPHEFETYYYFEYSTDQITWSGLSYYAGAMPANESPKEVSFELTGLVASTKYWVRMVASNFVDPNVISAEPNPTFTTTVIAPPTVAIDPVASVTANTARFSGKIDPEAPAGNPSVSDIHWHFECTPECPGLEGGAIAADSAEHVVTAEATGLKPLTAYEVKLVATNAGPPVSAGPEHFTTTALAAVDTLPAFALAGGTKALLAGTVNPENSTTQYWFEYGPTESYGLSVPVTHDADAGLGEAPNFVTQEVAGLQPATTYHYRVRASNSAGTATSQDQTFTTPPLESASSIGKLKLPDGRVWEEVSPADKHDYDIYGSGAVASKSGDALSFKSQGSFVDQPTSRAGTLTDYLARRGEVSWATHGTTPFGLEFNLNVGVFGYSDELEKLFIMVAEKPGRSLDPEIEPTPPPEGFPSYSVNSYVRDNVTGKYKAFGKSAQVENMAASGDYAHVAVQARQNLPSEAPCEAPEPGPPGQPCVFEMVNGVLHRASISPTGTPSYGQLVGSRGTGHAVSADGASLYFTNAGNLYRRTNGSVTIQIGQSERTAPPVTGGGSTSFVSAEAAHGDRVLLQSTAELVDADDNASTDLYIYDAGKPAGEQLTLISQGDKPAAQAEVQGVASASDDLHRVYFYANNQILSGEPNTPGPKLYMWEDNGGQGRLAYVASYPTNSPRISHPDGRYLVFPSTVRETAYDNAGHTEFYRYDAVTGQLVCATCNPKGLPANEAPTYNFPSEVPIPEHELRNVSTSGQVFFETREALVPSDSNGQIDVYEYENGGPHLISSGVGGSKSVFLDASQSGNDVFFAASDSLVGWDIDHNIDAYDARVNGGLPEPPPGTSACEGDSCLAPLNPPNDETPASASFSGQGNVTAPKSAPKPKPLTRAQKLAKAVKACKKHKSKKRRSACEKKAKKLYGRSK